MTTRQFPSPHENSHPAPPVAPHPPAVSYVRAGQVRQNQQFAPIRQMGPVAPGPVASGPVASGPVAPGPFAPGGVVPGGNGPYYLGPQVPGVPGSPPPSGAAPVAPTTPWWQREGMISRILAGLGVLITLIGVVMTLVLAAQAGYFGPAARVGAGAALSVALIAGGVWLNGREGGRVGAVALATTGFAGLFMVTVSMTSYYHWLHPVAGLTLAGLVAAVAVTLSTYWRSQPMTVLAFLAIAGLSPVITDGLTLSLVGFLLVLQAVGIAPEKLRGWASIAPVRTVPVVLALLVAQSQATSATFTLRIVATAVCAALGLLTAVVRTDRAEWLSAVVYAVASLPIIAAIPTLDRPFNVLAAVIVALLTAVAMVIARPVGALTMTAGVVVASLAVLEAVCPPPVAICFPR